jgi:hypothetical protein
MHSKKRKVTLALFLCLLLVFEYVSDMKFKRIFCINCTSVVNKSAKPSRKTWRDVSEKNYRWLHEFLKARGVQLQSEMIICNKSGITMYKENKRRRHDKPHTALDSINDDNEERNAPEIGHDLRSFNDFLVSDDIMGNSNDLDYCSMCLKMENLMPTLCKSERMTLLSDHRIYVSPNARRCVTARCETPCERPQEPTRLSSHQVRLYLYLLTLECETANIARRWKLFVFFG